MEDLVTARRRRQHSGVGDPPSWPLWVWECAIEALGVALGLLPRLISRLLD